jgi:hypothetical protein
MSRISICLAAAVAIALAALVPLPAQAGSGDGYVEGGYGLGWYGGRPYYYTPFGAYGGNSYQYRSETTGLFPSATVIAATIIASGIA